MPKFGDNSYLITGIVTWDGFTRPEEKKGEDGTTYLQYDLTIALDKSNPEIPALEQMLQQELAGGLFKGRFPAGGHWGIKAVDPAGFDGRLPNHVAVKAVSYQIKQVFIGGQEVPAMIYANKIYPGAVVTLLITPRSYNNISKGLGWWLGGVEIIDDKAPRLPVGGVDAAAAFGAGAGAQPPPTQQYAQQAGPAAPQPYGGGQQYAPQTSVQGYVPPGPPAANVQPPPTGYPAGGVQPAPNFLAPPPVPGLPPAPAAPAHQMTAKAGGMTYEQFRANPAWTDELLRSEGYML